MVLSWWLRAIAWVHQAVHLMNADWAPPTLKPSQPTWAVSLPIIGSYHPHLPSSFIIITQPESWYSFYCPTEGRRLSWPRHCRTGAAARAQDCVSQWLLWYAGGVIRTWVLSHSSQVCYCKTTATCCTREGLGQVIKIKWCDQLMHHI